MPPAPGVTSGVTGETCSISFHDNNMACFVRTVHTVDLKVGADEFHWD